MRLNLKVIMICLLASTPALAQQEAARPVGGSADQASAAAEDLQIAELRRRIDLLARELEELRSGETPQIELSDDRRRSLGLAPSAAATYRRASAGVSFAGYGEMLLENFGSTNEAGATGAPTTRLDFLRAILYTGYRFNDKFLFNSEIEVEHSNEISVEFAYLDYLATDSLTVRAGLVLLPVGLVNEFHEPTVFLGARRPETEQRLIPSTWRENGVGVLGSFGPVNVRAFVTNGLNGAGFTSAGLRGGRQKGGQARAAHLAFSGRLDVTPVPGVITGVSVYRGGSGQEQLVFDGERLDLSTTVAEVHGQGQVRGVDIRALFARATVDQARAASLALGLSSGAPIAEVMHGGYVQVGYNLLSQFRTPLAVTPYLRYERLDTQHRAPQGFTRDLARDGRFTTLGVEFKPIPNISIKTDYQWISNAAHTGRPQFNVNMGYAF